MTRPGPILWLRYLVTGGLPEQYGEWVLHDATCRTWWLRHVARFLIQMTPLAVAAALIIPAPLPIRVGVAVVGVVGTAFFALGFVAEGAERRVEKAGYRYGLAAELREQRALATQHATAERNRARRAARMQQRRA